jgi:ABC-type multidrug transport system ATPase subunit
MRKTISGGERKRTCIGIELVTDPSIIILDEPTSGLDSFMAKSICKTLQKIAHDEGKTVIATIHQPSSEAFYYFDRLMLMCDGHIVYQGIANRAPRYFDSLGFKILTFNNPTDIFMRIISINYPKEEEDNY